MLSFDERKKIEKSRNTFVYKITKYLCANSYMRRDCPYIFLCRSVFIFVTIL